MSSVRSAQSLLREATRGLRAVNWPVRDRPVAALAVLVSCGVVGLCCGWLSRSASMGLLAGGAVAVAMWQMWVPIRAEFGPRGITLTCLRSRRRIYWRDIDHLEMQGDGVFLCGEPRGEDGGRGHVFYLPWVRNREAITTFCQEYSSLRPVESSGAPPARVPT